MSRTIEKATAANGQSYRIARGAGGYTIEYQAGTRWKNATGLVYYMETRARAAFDGYLNLIKEHVAQEAAAKVDPAADYEDCD